MVQYLHFRILKFPLKTCPAAPISKVPLEMGPVWIPATLLHVYPFLATTANNQSSNQGGLCKYGHRRRARHATSFLYAGWLRAVFPVHRWWYAQPNVFDSTSSTAQGGGGSFKNWKPIGEVGCCESGMAERSHWWSERWLISLTISLSFPDYLPTYLSIYLSNDLSIYLSLSLFHLITYLSISLSLSFICLAVYLSICGAVSLSVM